MTGMKFSNNTLLKQVHHWHKNLTKDMFMPVLEVNWWLLLNISPSIWHIFTFVLLINCFIVFLILPGMFNVFLQKNSKTSFSGDYLLQVTGDSVVLHASSSGEIPVVTWKIKALRRYGCSDGRFNFEAGRLVMAVKCNIINCFNALLNTIHMLFLLLLFTLKLHKTRR